MNLDQHEPQTEPRAQWRGGCWSLGEILAELIARMPKDEEGDEQQDREVDRGCSGVVSEGVHAADPCEQRPS